MLLKAVLPFTAVLGLAFSIWSVVKSQEPITASGPRCRRRCVLVRSIRSPARAWWKPDVRTFRSVSTCPASSPNCTSKRATEVAKGAPLFRVDDRELKRNSAFMKPSSSPPKPSGTS